MPATTYQIDTAHSHAQFKVRHMMIANVGGEFSKMTGTVIFDPENPSASEVSATIDVSTINTRETQRDEHLKSNDFFDVARYPLMKFVSRDIVTTGPESFEMNGDLTIRGVTRPLAVTVEDLTAEAKDPWGNLRRGACARAKFSRKSFGLAWNVALEAGGFLVGDEVEITIDVELIRQTPQESTSDSHALNPEEISGQKVL
jgi:polyisoprenoid-binding protein YceI